LDEVEKRMMMMMMMMMMIIIIIIIIIIIGNHLHTVLIWNMFHTDTKTPFDLCCHGHRSVMMADNVLYDN
jgi:hypothetical protein